MTAENAFATLVPEESNQKSDKLRRAFMVRFSFVVSLQKECYTKYFWSGINFEKSRSFDCQKPQCWLPSIANPTFFFFFFGVMPHKMNIIY